MFQLSGVPLPQQPCNILHFDWLIFSFALDDQFVADFHEISKMKAEHEFLPFYNLVEDLKEVSA